MCGFFGFGRAKVGGNVARDIRSTFMTRARGLGKRPAAESSREKEPDQDADSKKNSQDFKNKEPASILEGKGSGGDEPRVCFPVGEEQNDIEQVESMLAHAEISFDSPEKCVRLLCAVIHECDRLGRMQDHSETVTAAGHNVLQTNLKTKLCSIMGDALYRLAFLETAEADSESGLINGGILDAAIERYEAGLEHSPDSKNLKVSLNKGKIVRSIAKGALEKTALDDYMESLRALSDDERTAGTLSVFEVIEFAFESAGDFLTKAAIDVLRRFSRELSNFILEGGEITEELKPGCLKLLFSDLEFHFDEDNYKECLAILKKCRPIVDSICVLQGGGFGKHKDAKREEIAQTTGKKTSGGSCKSEDEPDSEQDDERDEEEVVVFSSLRAQYYIWIGCLLEAGVQDDFGVEGAAKGAYSNAVAIYQELEKTHGMPVPEHILELVD